MDKYSSSNKPAAPSTSSGKALITNFKASHKNMLRSIKKFAMSKTAALDGSLSDTKSLAVNMEKKEERNTQEHDSEMAMEPEGDNQMDVDPMLQIPDLHMYRLEDSEGHECTLLRAQSNIQGASSSPDDTLNILMADVSGSMSSSWPHVMQGWNEHIKNKLFGTTKLHVFDSHVHFLREDTTLQQSDFKSGGTNITEALRQLRSEVNKCRQKFLNVFIITDGDHGYGKPLPETQISLMSVPPGKTVNVYLLGITTYFPVNYSIDIRSYLHNGNANTPSLYWAKETGDIVEQMTAMALDLSGGNMKMTVNQEGYILPGLDSTSTISPGDWLYIPKSPEEIADVELTIGSETKKIPRNVMNASMSVLLDHLFPQWNNVLIQQHRKRLPVPKETFGLMESLFKANFNKLEKMNRQPDNKSSSVKDRIDRKNVQSFETKFCTLMNLSRTVISIEGKYENEIELANSILKSTVSSQKYGTKILKMRGHGLDDFENDIAAFHTIYAKAKPSIMALPPPPLDDCCRITASSTLSDLQDEDFPLLLDEGKFALLKDFTMTGIPAYVPVRDASQINVWTLAIRHMLVTPFAVLSQRAIEAKAGLEGADNALGFIDKDVQLMADDEKTNFNVIIPILPAAACKALKTVVRSNFYAMMTTFCILKNPHIIDHSAHLAALACAWVKSIAEHPPASRPSYVSERLAAVVATAELYMDRKPILSYLSVLATAPRQTLMTESTETFEGHTLKCESLVKPLFFLGLKKDAVTAGQLQEYLQLLLAEFVGRCVSTYKTKPDEVKDATPFTDFFCPQLNDSKKKEEWLRNSSQSLITDFKASHKNLLSDFYAPENLLRSIKEFSMSKTAALDSSLSDTKSLAVNMEKVKRLRHVGSCGDVRFYTFRAWAQEMGIPEEQISAAYDPAKVLVCVCEALLHRSSRERLAKEPASHAQCLQQIKTQVTKENKKSYEQIYKKMSEVILSEWREEYFAVHKNVVTPLSRKEVLAEAQGRGIQVTEETFSAVYRRYNAEYKMVRNACQILACPFYLVPNRSFNQHLAVERMAGRFPQALHLVCKELCGESVSRVQEEIASGSHSGRQGRQKCPVKEPQSLQKLEPEIKELLQIYKRYEIK